MKSRSARLLTLLLAATMPLSAQQLSEPAKLNDPANLTGEHVAPQDLADSLPINHGALALQQLLRKLRTRASFMLIVAHPDDEDGGMLTYLSRGQGARVAMLTLNRGEGGENLMSSDFEDALGLIRTQELLAADRYMGVDQFFGTEVDFGFSKSIQESFAKWTHDRVLYDAVRAVRLYRPLVIASVFIGGPSDGHGQHQVAGRIAQEVFSVAGDPRIFPDQIAAGLQPWQPLKVYARVPLGRIDAQGIYDSATGQYTPAQFNNYVTGAVTQSIPETSVVVHEGTPDALLDGLSYFQFAREGLSLQKTQVGPNGRSAAPGPHDVAYHRYASHTVPANDDSPESTFFDGIDTSLAGLASLAPEASARFRPLLERIDQQVAQAEQLFDASAPQRCAPPLRLGLGMVDDFIGELEKPAINDLPALESANLLHELRIKRVQLNDALLLADGITLDAAFSPLGGNPALVTTAQRIDVSASLHTSASIDVQSIAMKFLGVPVRQRPAGAAPAAATAHLTPKHLAPGDSREETLHALVDQELPATRPYFSRPDIEQPFYDIADPALRNAPATPVPLTVSAVVIDHGVPLELIANVADPSAKSPRQAVVVVPPVSVNLPVHAAVVPVQRPSFSISYSAFNPEPAFAPQFRLELPPLWTYTVPRTDNPVPEPPPAGRISRQTAFVTAADPSPYRAYPITVVTEIHGHQYREGYRAVGYPGLEKTNLYTPTLFHATTADLAVPPGLEIGYLPGSGDDVPAALDDLGVRTHIILPSDLTLDTLRSFDAVILGVRAYEAHPELAAANPALNAYAAAGGIVIAQYNTGRLPDHTGPFPLSLGSNEKVVEENARVRILAPAAPILIWPNQITPADFENWIEERGHGFMATWDPRYQALLETHDAGQQPQRGGLLIARTGRGAWIYLGLALYRQLPEGVPGAYRILANLISAGKNAEFLAMPAPETTSHP